MMLYPLHVTSDEINTQRGTVTCPRSHSTHSGRTGPELRSPNLIDLGLWKGSTDGTSTSPSTAVPTLLECA